MRASRYLASLATVIISLSASAALAESLEGRWDASVTIRGTVIPFRLDLAGEGASFTGTLFNGDIPVTPTAAKFDNGTVTLNFEHYLTSISATLKDNELDSIFAQLSNGSAQEGAGESAKVYVVQKGDSPAGIAKKFKVSYADLLRANNISDPKKLQIGQKLAIP